MPFSVLLYESKKPITTEELEKIREYYDDKSNLNRISMFREMLTEGGKQYEIFRVAKLLTDSFTVYSINDKGAIVPSENEIPVWDTCYVYIRKDSKYLYVRGSSSRWIGEFLSQAIYKKDDEIVERTIDIKKIEEDIKKSSRFRASGKSFVDADGTKITVKNPSGIDLGEHYTTKGKEDALTNYICIFVEADDLTFDVKVYPNGKVTFPNFVTDPTTALRMFLKIWQEIKDYS